MFRVFCLGIGILILLIGASFAQSVRSVLNSTQLIVSEPVPVPSEPAVGGASLKVTGGIMTLKNSQNASGGGGLTGVSGVSIGVSGISATVNATASDAYLVTQKAVYDYINYRVEVLLKDTIQNLSVKLDKLNIVGMIAAFGASTPPDGWLECNGASVSFTEYKELYARIGDKFGSSAAGTFKLPDLRGRAPIGAGTGVVPATGAVLTPRELGQSVGQESVSRVLALNQIPSHTHPYDDIYYSESMQNGYTLYPVPGNAGSSSTDDDNSGLQVQRTTGATGGLTTTTTAPFTTETMQPSLVVKYYIRALP